MAVVAALPWWAGVGLAFVSFVVLRGIAANVVVDVQSSEVSTAVTRTIFKTLASVGQFVVPILCLGGAGISVWKRRSRRSLIADVAQPNAASAVDRMTWREFEMLVGEGFRLQGYQVNESGGGGPDGGVDLVLTKPGRNGGEKFFVQCKHWRALKVGVDVVRELFGVMAARGAAGGFVVTSGQFTTEAVAFASGRNVNLLDGPKLLCLIAEVKARTGESLSTDETANASQASRSKRHEQEPSCLICNKPMVRRTARRGATPGSQFWGCTGYPSCRGTRPASREIDG